MEDRATQTDFPVPPQFLNEYELYELEMKWSQCASVREFCWLAKLPHQALEMLQTAFNASGLAWEDFMQEQSYNFVRVVRDILEAEGLQYGIWWPRFWSTPLKGDRDIDRTVKVYAELIKVGNPAIPHPAKCGDYWAILRRVLPSTSVRIQTQYDPSNPNRRMDGWWTGA